MLLNNFDLLLHDPFTFLILLLEMLCALLVGITVHESSHALVSFRLGDYTAKALGRLSLNPLRHLDPVGTVMLVLVGFGWGKPVPVNPLRVAGGRRGLAIVSAAGPVSNIIAASLFAIPFKLGLLSLTSLSSLSAGLGALATDFLYLVVYYNLVLAVFNLIPIFPLDGSKVLWGVLPEGPARQFARLEPYGPAILIGLVAVSAFTNGLIFNRTLVPVIHYLLKLILGQQFF